ncbi:hypothetical protein HC891_10935 [Candidatus Gracilibacteria bacterium]|nr:hypothetical protein [Candidatus Gracilibacteria bacterium]
MPTPIGTSANKETPLALVFEEEASGLLTQSVVQAVNVRARIEIVEAFLLDRMRDKRTIDALVQKTIDALFETKGSAAIKDIVNNNASSKRQLERDFVQNIGISPKQFRKSDKKEFTGTTPNKFFGADIMALSSLFYKGWSTCRIFTISSSPGAIGLYCQRKQVAN